MFFRHLLAVLLLSIEILRRELFKIVSMTLGECVFSIMDMLQKWSKVKGTFSSKLLPLIIAVILNNFMGLLIKNKRSMLKHQRIRQS